MVSLNLFIISFICFAGFILAVFLIIHYKILTKANRKIHELSNQLIVVQGELGNQAKDLQVENFNLRKQHHEEVNKILLDQRDLIESRTNEFYEKTKKAREDGFKEGERQAELRISEKIDAFSVVVRPYFKQIKQSNIINKSYKVEIGYQYQLKVKNIPCFSPHVIIERTIEDKQINIETISKIAVEIAKMAIDNEIGGARTLIDFIAEPVIGK